MEKVVVLMSTYNGEIYLKEQLNSLINLKKNNFEIFIKIRDDGSNDNTQEILEEYCNKYENIEWYQGKNCGPAHSFLELLSREKNYEYYAFCDQDDVWEDTKLLKAVEKMRKYKGKETLYFSAVNLVDKQLNFLTKREPLMKITFENSFILNPVIGCTLVINDKLKTNFEKMPIVGEIGMHDSLIYRMAQSTDANIIYDENAYIKYRQHENNVLGINSKKSIKQYIEYLIKPRKRIIANVAGLILKTYDKNVSSYKREVLKDIYALLDKRNIKAKLKIVCNKKFNSGNLKQDLKFKYDVFFNRK